MGFDHVREPRGTMGSNIEPKSNQALKSGGFPVTGHVV
jgi:hypothetical protein